LRCPAASLARTPASSADRGTRYAIAYSAAGSAQARGPSGIPKLQMPIHISGVF
jgi:hypothetical protein